MEPMPWYRIAAPIVACLVLFAVAAAGYTRFRFAALGLIAIVGYGVLQDQISVRLCPEYFTVFHPPIAGVSDPTLLGVAWGFLGSWWGGICLGYSAGLTATLGKRPKLSPRELVVPLVILLLVLAAVVSIAGLSVWRHAEMFEVKLDQGFNAMLPLERHRGLLIVACYHMVAYAVAILGGLVLCVWIHLERVKRGRASPQIAN